MQMLCLRRKFVGHVANSHGATARALGHAGSLQRVRRALFNFARRHSEGALTRAILAEGSLGTLRIRTAPQRERLGTQDPCRRFGGHFSNSHGVAARALGHAQSSQRVCWALYAFARRHSESASRRATPAEGSSGTVRTRETWRMNTPHTANIDAGSTYRIPKNSSRSVQPVGRSGKFSALLLQSWIEALR